MIEQYYDLNLIPGGIPVIVNVSQADANTRTLVFRIFNRNQLFTIPSGVNVDIVGTKPDGHSFYYDCTTEGYYVKCDVKDQMTPVKGDVECKVRFTKNSGKDILGTSRFILRVDRSCLPDDPNVSASFLPLIEEAIKLAPQVEANAQTAVNAANTATNKATAASNSATAAKTSETNASNLAKAAKTSETNSKTSETNAKNSATAAKTSETNAASHEKMAKSYAMGDTGVRTGEATDNSKYYYEQTKKNAELTAADAKILQECYGIAVPKMHIDFSTMQLIQDNETPKIVFSLDTNKVLSYNITVSTT